MKILNLKAGSPEWHKHRATARNASEAPAVMGVHKNVTRNELLEHKALGTEQEFSRFVQERVLDNGHEVEAAARPIANKIVGEAVDPEVATDDDGYLSVSFDGITAFEDIVWECKQWSREKVEIVEAGQVPECDRWQVVQQLVVSRADKALYMVTDGTEENTVYTWMTLEPEDEKRLRAGWAQFDADLANYQAPERKAAPEGRSPEALPALRIEVQGEVTASNLEEFRDGALAVIQSINTDLQTDSDFADAEKTVKWCKGVEDKLEAAKEYALSQTASIDQLFRAVDEIKEETRARRLELNRLMEERKKSIREEIRSKALTDFHEHLKSLDTRLGGNFIPEIKLDVAGAMKGKRTIESLRNAAETAVANAKVEATQWAEKIEQNLATVQAVEEKHQHLLHDVRDLVLKDHDDLKEIVNARIVTWEAEEQRRLEAERERIRQEEERRAQERVRQEERRAEEARRQEQEGQKAAEEDAQKAVQAETKSHGAVPGDAQAIPPEHKGRESRPGDAEIIAVLSAHYRVPQRTVVEWLRTMNLDQLAA